MEVTGDFFSGTLLWWVAAGYGAALIYALRLAPWARLRNSEQLHVFLGAAVVLMLLWHMRVEVVPGLAFHLLGVTALTLMLGWSLAIVAASLALFGVTLNSGFEWQAFAVNAMITGVVPVTLTQVLLVLIRSLLPKQFFIYVLVNGFLTGGVVGIFTGYLATWLLMTGGAYTFAELDRTFLPFFPLMFLPEAILNGWIMVMMVAFRPNWVGSFSDELYIKGK